MMVKLVATAIGVAVPTAAAVPAAKPPAPQHCNGYRGNQRDDGQRFHFDLHGAILDLDESDPA